MEGCSAPQRLAHFACAPRGHWGVLGTARNCYTPLRVGAWGLRFALTSVHAVRTSACCTCLHSTR